MKTISILTACYNEEENIDEVIRRVRAVFSELPYEYEHIFIDNASTDRTVEKIRENAAVDPHVKAILNTRNFGHIRSPYYGITHCEGDAVISLVCDLQDPPELIPELIQKWEEGYKVVVAIKKGSKENPLIYFLRSCYYKVLHALSNVEIFEQFTGFGLYDRCVVDELRQIDDPYPFFRGLIAELGYPAARVEYVQPQRERGVTKNNIRTLYDMAMLGFTNYSKVPLRLAAILGFASSILCLLVALFYLVYKLCNWYTFSAGMAPLVIGLFFMGSVQLFFLGIIGEYIGTIYTQVKKRSLVIEKGRINFDKKG